MSFGVVFVLYFLYWSAGRFLGISTTEIKRLVNCWNSGPTKGLLELWTYEDEGLLEFLELQGFQDCQGFGLLGSGPLGAWVVGSSGTLGPWGFGSLGLWVGLWVSGSLGPWVPRSLGLQVSGSLGLWVSRSLGLWVSGSLGFWVFGLLCFARPPQVIVGSGG